MSLFLAKLPFPACMEQFLPECIGKWEWFCRGCVRKLPWSEFDRDEHTGWPVRTCHQCAEKLDRIESGFQAKGRDDRHARNLLLNRLPGAWVPTDGEAFIGVILSELGGINGLAALVREILASEDQSPEALSIRARLCAAVIRASEINLELDMEQRKLTAAENTMRQKSLKEFTEQELRDALMPMLNELLRNSPEVGIKSLKQGGYVVARTPADLARQIRDQGEKYLREVFRHLMDS